jgi:predicted DCC family thiol-disulfide oxidoreductase YuxK
MKIEVGKQAYLLFDGDCGICTWSAELVRKMDRRKLFMIHPYQSFPAAELQRVGITYAQCEKKLQVISRRGHIYQGAFGVNYFLWQYFPWSLLVALIYALPLLLLLEIIGYAWVARNRHRLSQWFGFKACLLRR